MLKTPGPGRHARRLAAIALVAAGLAACSGGRSPAGPEPAAAPTTPVVPTRVARPRAPATTAPATTAAPASGGASASTAPPAGPAPTDAARLAATLTRTERAIRDPATPGRELPALGRAQQLAYRVVIRDPALLPKVLALVPVALRPVVRANAAAGIDLRKLSRPGPRLPPWRIVSPRPAAELLAAYHDAEAKLGVPWSYLAAINAGRHRLRRADAREPAGLPRLPPVAGVLRGHPPPRGLPRPPRDRRLTRTWR
jgi:hypothetical protein